MTPGSHGSTRCSGLIRLSRMPGSCRTPAAPTERSWRPSASPRSRSAVTACCGSAIPTTARPWNARWPPRPGPTCPRPTRRLPRGLATAVSPPPVSPPAASSGGRRSARRSAARRKYRRLPPATPHTAGMPSTGLSYAGSLSNRQPSAIMRLPSKVLRIGRAADNDVVVVRPERLPLPRRAAAGAGRLRGRRPREPQRNLPQRPADLRRARHRDGHHRHRGVHVPPGRRGTPGVHRHRRHLTHRPRPHGHAAQRAGAARSRQLPAGRALPARGHRPERRGQVHAARGADRDAAGYRGQRAIRPARPLHALRGIAAPDRARPAGKHPAHPVVRTARPRLRGRAAVPARHEQGRAAAPDHRGARGAVSDGPRGDQDRLAVRRPAETRQRRA